MLRLCVSRVNFKFAEESPLLANFINQPRYGGRDWLFDVGGITVGGKTIDIKRTDRYYLGTKFTAYDARTNRDGR